MVPAALAGLSLRDEDHLRHYALTGLLFGTAALALRLWAGIATAAAAINEAVFSGGIRDSGLCEANDGAVIF
ncbi:hypothetical protein ACFQI3_04740 [Hansschlegelia quercus]|uniref:Uncharacterized protein n=1 Tax=Hansschlegelia quercus TaxID=2528245 RepID=A0A4Q9GLH1_9HYPH|nr:hypothetical protein [Hansschlegelia quercus]TBN55183.1 hypothetical protein EYR15_03335 [Hansschlegelia quercus]